jgi:hypothetical protein
VSVLDLYLWRSQLAEWQYTFADDALRAIEEVRCPGGRKGKP